MGKATGKANHPHNKERPIPAAIRNALAKQDMKALRLSLTPRQRAFAEEYVVDFNGKAAAIRAGYSTKYPDRQGSILLHHEGIAAYITHLTASKEAKITSLDPDYITSRILDIVNRDGCRDGDALRGLELLAKHLGMFIERQEISGPDGKEIEIRQKETRERADSFLELIDRTAKKVELKAVK